MAQRIFFVWTLTCLVAFLILEQSHGKSNFNKGMTAKITKIECSKPNETTFCTKIGCQLKPINRTASMINSYCDFNGSRSDIRSNFEVSFKSTSNRFFPAINATEMYCQPTQNKIGTIFFITDLIFKSQKPNALRPCPLQDYMGVKNMTYSISSLEIFPNGISSGTYRVSFNYYTKDWMPFYSTRILIDIKSARLEFF